jgi:hypothetical protein
MATIIDTLRALQQVEENLARNAESYRKLQRLGGLTQADVRRYDEQRTRVYKMELVMYNTVLQTIADTLPLVEVEDLRSRIPQPQPAPPLLSQADFKRLPRGLGFPPAAAPAAAPAALGWAAIMIAVIAAIAVVAAVFVVAGFAASVAAYAAHLLADNAATEARAAALQACLAAGRTVEECTGAANAAAPPPPQPPKPPDWDRLGGYLVWGLVGLAGLSVLPVILRAFSGLGGGGEKKPRSGGIVIRPEETYD